MNILTILNDKGIKEQIIYYGKNDLATWNSVENLLKSKELILDYYYNHNNGINDINDYIDYLFGKYILKFKEIIDLIAVDYLNEFNTFYDNFFGIFKPKTKNVISYINDNYLEIFNIANCEDFGLQCLDIEQITADYIGENIESFTNDVIGYVLSSKFYEVIDSFNIWKRVIKKNKEYFCLLFNKENLEKYFEKRDTYIYDAIEKLIDCELLKDEINKFVEEIYKMIIEKYYNAPNVTVYSKYYVVCDFYKFLLDIKSEKVDCVQKIVKQLKIELNQCLVLYGNQVTLKIDLNDFDKLINNDSVQPLDKVLSVTHTRDNNNKYVSFIQNALHMNNPSYMGIMCKKDIHTNDFFTDDVINKLSLSTSITNHKLKHILNNNDYYNGFFDALNIEIKAIYNALKDKSLIEEAIESFAMIEMELKETTIVSATLTKNKIYELSCLICALFEKLIRDVYVENTNIRNYTKKGITLGQIFKNLNDNWYEPIYKEEFRVYRFFLAYDDEKKLVGYGWRNALMHLDAGVLNDLDEELMMTLMSLLVCLINSTYIYYVKEE